MDQAAIAVPGPAVEAALHDLLLERREIRRAELVRALREWRAQLPGARVMCHFPGLGLSVDVRLGGVAPERAAGSRDLV